MCCAFASGVTRLLTVGYSELSTERSIVKKTGNELYCDYPVGGKGGNCYLGYAELLSGRL